MDREEKLDVWHYLSTVLRWWWLILLLPLGTWVALWLIDNPPTESRDFTAETRILIQQVSPTGVITFDDLFTSEELAKLYTVLIQEESVLSQVEQQLDLEPGSVAEFLQPEVLEGQPILQVKVTHPDPVLAASIANTVSDVFIEDTRQLRLGEVVRLQEMAERLGVNPGGAFLAQQLGAMGSFVMVRRASAPSTADPVYTGGGSNTLAVVVALAVALLLAFALEWLLDRVRSPERLESLAGKKPLGVIPRWSPRIAPNYESIMVKLPHSRYAEAYRQVVVALQDTWNGSQSPKSFMITSAVPYEGKTTTAVNLAIALQESGRKVVLVDGDIWRPSVHQWFHLDNNAGFSNFFMELSPPAHSLMRPTEFRNLSVITSGPRVNSQGQMLEKAVIDRLLATLKQEADVVIFDSPPILGQSFAALLASAVDRVIMIADASKTNTRNLRRALEMTAGDNGHMVPTLSLVLNRFQPSRAECYGYYGDYYGVEGGEANGHGDGRGNGHGDGQRRRRSSREAGTPWEEAARWLRRRSSRR